MDKQRKIILPDGREEIVRFVNFERRPSSTSSVVAWDYYSLVTDNATYQLWHPKNVDPSSGRCDTLPDRELPLVIVLKRNSVCEFPELPKIGKPGIPVRWLFQRRLHTAAEETRLQREAWEQDKTESKAKDQKTDDKERVKRARGKDGGRSPKDGQGQVEKAVTKVLELREYNKSKSMTMERACKNVITELALTIKWQALAKHVRMSPKWKTLKKRIGIARK